MRYNKQNDKKTMEETLFNTQMAGKVHSIQEKSIMIQVLSDGECFLLVPRSRVPKSVQIEGQEVKIFLTTKYGHFGITALPEPKLVSG